MTRTGESIRGTKPLPAGESASVPATASASARYLFVLPDFKNGGSFEDDIATAADATLTIKGISKPAAVKLLADGSALEFDRTSGEIKIKLPAAKRSTLVEVVQIRLAPVATAN